MLVLMARGGVLNNDEFCIKNDELCIKSDEIWH